MRLMFLTAALVGVALTTGAWAAEPITKRQARTLPAGEVNHRVMNQVADLFETPVRQARATPPVRALGREYFETVPRTTLVRGLCRMDQLAVEFASAGGAGSGADQRSRASGFTASSRFAFAEEPPSDAIFHSDLLDNREQDFVPRAQPCAKASPEDVGYFEAPSAETATDGYLLFRRMLAEAPKADWALDCDLFPAEVASGCGKILAALAPSSIWSVEPCSSDRPEFSGARCYFYQAGERTIRIYSTAQASRIMAGGRLELIPMRILRVELKSSIMIADTLID